MSLLQFIKCKWGIEALKGYVVVQLTITLSKQAFWTARLTQFFRRYDHNSQCHCYQWNHTLSQCRGLLGEPPSPLVNPAWRAESEPVDAFLCQPMLNIKCFPAFLYESVCISIWADRSIELTWTLVYNVHHPNKLLRDIYILGFNGPTRPDLFHWIMSVLLWACQ